MYTALKSFLVIASVLGIGIPATAQTLDTLMSNNQQLQVTLGLDRSAYFPNEAAAIAITILNPTATPLQVVAPFRDECFTLSSVNSDGTLTVLGADGCSVWPDSATPSTTIFAPGEQRQYRLNSYDGSFASSSGPLGNVGAPGTPGNYVAAYSYNATTAAFSVVQPSLDTAAVVSVPDVPYTDPTTGDNTPLAQYVHVFSLRSGSQSYLCVSQPQTNADPVALLATGLLNFPAVYKRIATSVNPIVSISPVADDAGNLTITWKDSNNVQTVTPYPANGGDTVAPVVISYRVVFGSQAFELNTSTRNRLPWQIIGIEVAFSKPIANATINSLTGVTATAVAGVGTNTLVWTINPVSGGTVSTTLAANGPNGISDGAGNALGGGIQFSKTFNVLGGDFNDDGVVNAADLSGVNAVIQGSVYNIFADLNGDGVVNSADAQLITQTQPNLIVTSSLTRDANTNIVAVVTLTNIGSAATNVQLTAATIGTTAALTALPISIGAISAGGVAQTTVIFPGSAGTTGTAAIIRFSGTYPGENFGSGARITLP
jgi:Dockerin type I domain